MIIIEGADGAGKTHTANYLSSRLHQPIKHLGKHAETFPAIFERMKVFTRAVNDDIIFDRCAFFSERIYGPILRNACLLHDDILPVYRELFKNNNVKIVYCRPPKNIILSTILIEKLHKKLDLISKINHHIAGIIKAYDDLMHYELSNNMNILFFDRTETTLEELCVELFSQ